MERMTFDKKSLNTQRPRVDRFIVPRTSLPELQRRLLWGNHFEKQQNDGEIWYAKNVKQRKYMNYLNKVFDLEPLATQKSKYAELCKSWGPIWPCVPRKKSCLTSADSILDLPGYSYAAFPDLLDWSNDNILVAALGNYYHKWSWRTQSLIYQGLTLHEIQCCKFDPMGELLVLGTNPKIVEIHDNVMNKRLANIYCRCLQIDLDFCSITTIDWSSTGNSFVTGCSRGMLTAITRQSQVIRQRRVFPGTIFDVKVSPDARVVAVAEEHGNEVVLLCWPGLELYTTFVTNATIQALTWHPWRSALLAVSHLDITMHTSITLWNTSSGRFHKSNLGHGAHRLDNMLFSHRTGELVVSLWSLEIANTRTCSQLVVMSDPDTVVDQWGEGRTGLDRIRTMVFSPDGTKLATATADEDLIIWNFLPEDKSNKKKSRRRFSILPEYLDMTTSGFSLR